jgi:hypothetical protein
LFFSNRWGENIGSLRISTVQNTPNGEVQNLVWERNETQAREWRDGQINLRDIPYDFAMKIDGFVGNGWEGDVCLIICRLLCLILFNFRLRSMKSFYRMRNVHRHFGVILKHHFVDGLMIQEVISIGHEHKKQQIQVVLDHQQVTILKKQS